MAGLEASDEAWLQSECKKRGLLSLKQNLLIGVPDRILLGNEGRVVFVELKTPVGKLSPMQRWWQNKLHKLCFWCTCVDTRERLIDILDWLESGRTTHERREDS